MRHADDADHMERVQNNSMAADSACAFVLATLLRSYVRPAHEMHVAEIRIPSRKKNEATCSSGVHFRTCACTFVGSRSRGTGRGQSGTVVQRAATMADPGGATDRPRQFGEKDALALCVA